MDDGRMVMDEKISEEILKFISEYHYQPVKHKYINPDAGLPFALQRIGAPCSQCGRSGGDNVHFHE